MGAVDHHAARRDFTDLVHEHDAAALEFFNHVLVVHDLVKDVDRRALGGEDLLNRLDRHVDAGTETAGIGQNDLHRRLNRMGTTACDPTFTEIPFPSHRQSPIFRVFDRSM